MAADASKIFAGPATKIEVSSDGSNYTDLGFGTANAEITWEPQKAELLDQNEFQMNGVGKITFELVQTDSETLTVIKSYRTTKAYVRITAVDGQTYVVSGIYLSYNLKRGFKPGEPHILTVSGQRNTQEPDDWVTFPS